MKECTLYHPIEKEISVDLSLEEARTFLSVEAYGDVDGVHTVSWIEWEKKGGRADALRQILRKVVPVHVPLRFNNTRVRNAPKENSKIGKIERLPNVEGKGSGKGKKKSDHEFLAYIDGWCFNKKDGCKTTFFAGFEYAALMAMVNKDGPVPLKITFRGSCCHPKDSSGAGQVRGSDRQKKIDDINNPRIAAVAPKSMVKKDLAGMSSDAHHAQNYDGVVATAATAYNINRDAREALMKQCGFTGCKLSNINRARNQLIADDLERRQKVGDESRDCAGNFRGFSLDDDPIPTADTKSWVGLRLTLFNKTGVIIMHQLCKTGKAVLNYDGTGWIADPIIPLPKDQIVLHNILSVSPLNVFVGSADADAASRLVQPKILAEFISNRGAAPDHSISFLELLLQTEKHMFGCVYPPLLLSVDCAGQLANAFLEAYARWVGTGLIGSRVKFHNVLCVVMLRYECEASLQSTDAAKSTAAASAIARMKNNFALLIHECKCHVYRAAKEWLASTDRPTEIRSHTDAFNSILMHLVLGACTDWSLSEAFARFAVAMTIFRSETIPTPSFDVDSPTRNHHNPGEAGVAASAIASFVSKEASGHWVRSVQSMEEQVKAIVDKPRTKDKFCAVEDYIDPSIERAVAEGLTTSQVYLKKVDKESNKGTLGIAFYYGATQNDKGDSIPYMVGGFEKEVDLPFTACAIENPLHSKAMDSYLSKKLANKLGLFSCSLLHCIDKSHDTKVASSNAASEGLIRWEKESEDLKRHKSDPGLYMHHRWREHLETDRLFVTQIQSVSSRLDDRKKRAEAKADKASAEAKEEEDEYYSDVKWARDIWPVHEGQLKSGLSRAFEINRVGKTATDQHRALESHGISIDASFSSYPTYNDWMSGKRKSNKKLHASAIKIIESYISKADKEAKTTGI